MEGISLRMYSRLRRYYRRKMGYERLDGSGRRRQNTVQLGTNKGSRSSRVWRLKMKLKIQTPRKVSPKRLLLWLRDTYVKMMSNLASSSAMSAPVAGYGNCTGNRLVGIPIKEYDEKMLAEMYKSLVLHKDNLFLVKHQNLVLKSSDSSCLPLRNQ